MLAVFETEILTSTLFNWLIFLNETRVAFCH